MASLANSGHYILRLDFSHSFLVVPFALYQLLVTFNDKSSVTDVVLIPVLVLGPFLLRLFIHGLILCPGESRHISVLTRLMLERASRVRAWVELAFGLQVCELAFFVVA